MRNILPYIVVLILGIVIGSWLCREYHFRNDVKMVQTDTIYRYDTIRIEQPKEIRYKTTTKVIKVPVIDTIRVNDTICLQLPREVKEYKANEYYAKVSGYKPSLDYIEVYPRTTTITTTETIKKKAKKHHIGIGIETNYATAINIPVQVQYSYDIFPWLSVYGYGEYELIREQFGVGIGTQIDIGL